MEDLETFPEPAQDGDGVLDIGFVDQDGLESALQGGVVFDVLAILVERRRADQVQLAAGEHRLEHVAGVQGTFGRAGTDDGVKFVDEQQDSAFARLDLRQNSL